MRCGGYGYRCRCENVGGIGEPVTCQTLWLRRRPFLITLSSGCRREPAVCTGGPISTINTSLTSFREGTGLLGAYRFLFSGIVSPQNVFTQVKPVSAYN